MNITRVLKHMLAAALLTGALTVIAAPAAHAGVFYSVVIAPPPIPVYEQPYAPGYGYIWTPGYWAYGDDGYFWVDGAWVEPPYVGALWTPGYWGYGGSGYFWHPGCWARSVGYYGGINYGFGYFGTGFYGGYWDRDRFFYNRAYNRIGFRDHDNFIYNRRYGNYDGRPGGVAYVRSNEGYRGGEGYNRGPEVYRGAQAGQPVYNRSPEIYRGGQAGQPVYNRNGGAEVYNHGAYANGGPRGVEAGNGQYRGGYNGGGAQPTAHVFSGGNYGGQARSFPQGGGAGGARPNFAGGGNIGGPGAGGFHGGGGGFHGGGGRR